MSNDTTNTETTTPADVEPKVRRTRGPNKPKEITATQSVLLEVEAETERAEELHGEQNIPLLGGDLPSKSLSYYAGRAIDWQTINDDRSVKDKKGWDSILLEEVFEALGEGDEAKAREELVQVAATAVNAIRCIDRKNAKDAA